MFRNGEMVVVVRFVTVFIISLAWAIGTILAIAGQNGLNTRPASKVIPSEQGVRPLVPSAKVANFGLVISVNLRSSLAKPCITAPSTTLVGVVVGPHGLGVCI